MTEYVKWEPVVGQVPPDGCEFINKCNAVGCSSWPVWARSGNRTINDNDLRTFQFRIPAPTKENPVVINYFIFEERPEAVKEYKTLADVPEGVRCVVKYGGGGQVVRMRKNMSGASTDGICYDDAYRYAIVQILDPLPEPKLPTTMAEAEECRVYIASDGRHCFKGDTWVFVFNQLTLGHDGYFYSPLCRRTDTYAVNRIRITAATNIYAVPCVSITSPPDYLSPKSWL